MAELGMVGNADFTDDLDEEVVGEKRSYAWRPPRWLPVVLIVGIVLWGASISWMVAHIGGDGSATSTDPTSDVTDEIAVLHAKVDGLTQQSSTLTQEREALAKRVAVLEARPAAPAAAMAPTVMPSVFPTEAASVTPAVQAVQAVQAAPITDPNAYSIPRFAYWRTPDPTVTAVTPIATGLISRFFTNSADKYNCTSFTSQAEAQEALAANAPGDPNRLDMNANGVACEDITYPSGTPRNLIPLPNR